MGGGGASALGEDARADLGGVRGVALGVEEAEVVAGQEGLGGFGGLLGGKPLDLAPQQLERVQSLDSLVRRARLAVGFLGGGFGNSSGKQRGCGVGEEREEPRVAVVLEPLRPWMTMWCTSICLVSHHRLVKSCADH